MATMNTNYLNSNRGIIKIIQIIIGFILSGWLIGGIWSPDTGSPFGYSDYRLGYISTMNSVVVIVNIVLLVLNLLNLTMYSLERLYSIVVCLLFLLASIFLVWFIIVRGIHGGNVFVTAALIIAMFMSFLWDVKILQGEAPN